MKQLLFTSLLFVILITAGSSNAQMFWNHAASFSGTNSYLAVPNSGRINLTGSFTLECWIKPNTVTVSQGLIVKQAAPVASYMLTITPDGKLHIGTNSLSRLIGKTKLPANEWTHVAATYSSSNNQYRLFINGLVDTLTTATGSAPFASNDSLFVGKSSIGSSFSGLMDNVRIWDRALETNEVYRYMRTSLGLPNSGMFSDLMLSLPFQGTSSAGEIFTLGDWSHGGLTVINRNITPVSLKDRLSMTNSYNEAMEFDGNGDYLLVPATEGSAITGAFTMEAWVYVRGTVNANQVIMRRKVSPSGAGYSMFINQNNNLVVGINNASAGVVIGEPFPLKRWVHVAFTLAASGSAKFYIDGDPKSSSTLPMPIANTEPFLIGGTTTSEYFNGYIDELRLSKYEKTQEQIIKHMYVSEDRENDPNPSASDLVFNFDGYAQSNGDASMYANLHGNAKFSNPNTVSFAPISPLIRHEQGNFSTGYRIKKVNKRVPETGTEGVTYDTLAVNSSTPITDINFFTAVNHTFDADLDITVFAPNGDSAHLCLDRSLNTVATGDIINVFDVNADSSLTNNRYTSFAPSIKPESNINGIFGGDNPYGKWIIRFKDDAADDTGYVYSWGINLNNDISVGVETVSTITPEKFELSQNYPNPFNPVTNIKFSIPQSGIVKLKVFDILGREVATLVNELKQAGTYNADFDGSKLSSGAYFYRLEIESFTDTKKMLLVK